MKKLKTTFVLFLSMIAAGCFVSCSDWTKPEPLDIDTPSIQEANPLSYQEYLAKVRNYKKTYHPLMIGMFDNVDKTIIGRAASIKSVPEKVDIISLMNGDDLTDIQLSDIAFVREHYGTKVIYCIAYEDMRKKIDRLNAEILEKNTDAEKQAAIDGTVFVPIPYWDIAVEAAKYMDEQLALLDKYQYDGYALNYDGRSTQLMLDAEIEEMRTVQNIIFNKALAVMDANPDKIFIFDGRPQSMLDKSILPKFNYILIRAHSSLITALIDVTITVKLALLAPGVPGNNIIVSAPTYPGGITEVAHWVKTEDDFTKCGMAMYQINLDYFNPDWDYKNVREAINIMNPSPLK